MESTINNIYPWGRSFDEYRQMFRLTDDDLHRRILGCADGPASFNAVMTRRGHRMVSCDPLYHHDTSQIRARIDAVYPQMLERATRDRHRFVWNVIQSPKMLGQIRMAAMNEFLSDYEAGRRSGRYLAEALPNLPFAAGSFDLALCSHFLFLYSDELSTEEHIQAVRELCRVAAEIRIFPLVDMQGNDSRHVQPVIEALNHDGVQVQVKTVPYEFQLGAKQMLTLSRSEPHAA